MEKSVDKNRKKEFLEKRKKASSERYETQWDEMGVPSSKKKSKIRSGRIAKASGARFELRVRKDLTEKGRTVDKWSNNVDLDSGCIVPAKRKFNPFSKVMTIGTGFPDFISIGRVRDNLYSVIGIEVKMNGILSKIEKEKCAWYLRNKVFGEIWIARMERDGRKIIVKYDNFVDRYPKFMNNKN
jgi:hypothetical protein